MPIGSSRTRDTPKKRAKAAHKATTKKRSPGAGRKSKPLALQKLHGQKSGSKVIPPVIYDAVEGGADLWQAPEWFDDERRELWLYALQHSPKGILKASDRELLAIWVNASVMHSRAATAVQNEGLVVYSKKDGPMMNPHVAIMHKHALLLLKASSDIGFTPTSRATLARAMLPPPKPPTSGADGVTDAEYQTIDNFLEERPDKLN